jgi:hypothetical protein
VRGGGIVHIFVLLWCKPIGRGNKSANIRRCGMRAERIGGSGITSRRWKWTTQKDKGEKEEGGGQKCFCQVHPPPPSILVLVIAVPSSHSHPYILQSFIHSFSFIMMTWYSYRYFHVLLFIITFPIDIKCCIWNESPSLLQWKKNAFFTTIRNTPKFCDTGMRGMEMRSGWWSQEEGTVVQQQEMYKIHLFRGIIYGAFTDDGRDKSTVTWELRSPIHYMAGA